MTRWIRLIALAIRDLLLTAGPVVALAVGLLVAAYWYLQPMPPKSVTLATGQEQGAYAQFGQRYAEWIGRHGIEVKLRTTRGAAENLALLRDPDSGVDVAFVQGGVDETEALPGEPKDDGLIALGSLYHEPLWLFYREDSARRRTGKRQLVSLADLRGWTLNIGVPGSGVPHLIQRLLEANHVEPADLKLKQLEQTPAVIELIEGRIDALVFASAPEAAMVQMLLMTPGIRLLGFAQADAYSRRFPFLSPVVLPRGVVDLGRDLPPADVPLVAPKAMLLARDDLHPALAQLFAQAGRGIHGGAGWFHHSGDFPSDAGLDWPLAPEARRTMESGIPWLQSVLPFWIANLIDRMWVVLLSIIALLIPLTRVVPPLYQWRVRSRVFRWYAQLRRIEEQLAANTSVPKEELLGELAELDSRARNVSVPLSYAEELYALRTHIQLVRQRALGGDSSTVPDSHIDAAATRT